MKIGIVSDSHGGTHWLDRMLKKAEADEAECWLHAGDFVEDAEYLEQVSGRKVYKVAGNGDWPEPKAPYDLLVELAGYKYFLLTATCTAYVRGRIFSQRTPKGKEQT